MTFVVIDGYQLEQAHNATGYMYCTFTKTKIRRVQARITPEKGRGQVDLGTYDTAEEAAKAVAHYKLGELEAKGRLDKIERAPCGHVRAKCER